MNPNPFDRFRPDLKGPHFRVPNRPHGRQFSKTLAGQQVVEEPPANNALRLSLYPSVRGDTIQVTPGYVDNNMPQIGGTALDNSTAPSISITGSPFYVWILNEWEPIGVEVEPSTYAPSGGTLVTPVVIAGGTSIPSDVTPTVNTSTGAATLNGEQAFLIATVTGSAGNYSITSRMERKPDHRDLRHRGCPDGVGFAMIAGFPDTDDDLPDLQSLLDCPCCVGACAQLEDIGAELTCVLQSVEGWPLPASTAGTYFTTDFYECGFSGVYTLYWDGSA